MAKGFDPNLMMTRPDSWYQTADAPSRQTDLGRVRSHTDAGKEARDDGADALRLIE
jgi:hypothetical protein